VRDKVLFRIEEISRTIGDLVDKREQIINDLHRIDSDIDSLSMLIFELKNLLDSDTQGTTDQD
jgi:hypothetical protein